jgi:preprotein translocase subunit YajC
MRKGSVAIVPLLIAVMMIFWFMMIMGNENDQLHTINKIENLQRTQDRLLYSALKRRYELERNANESVDINESVNTYISEIMKMNNIDD